MRNAIQGIAIEKLLSDTITGEWGTKADNGKGVKVVRTTNFTNNGKLNLNNVALRNIPNHVIENKKLRNGDIILEKSGGSDNFAVGRVVYFDVKTEEDYLCNNFTQILRINKQIADSKYVFYCLLDIHRKGITKNFQNKTTGIRNLQVKRYLSQKIPIPPLTEQRKITSVLEKAESAREKRKEANRLTDEFLKSSFIEMFGDPIKNPKKWKIVKFGSLILLLTDYHANGSYKTLKEHVELLDKPDFALMIRTTDLENNNFMVGVRYISEVAYNFLEKTKVYGGEIIINKIGSAGKVYLMPNLNRPVSLGMNQFMIRLNEETNNIFIYHLLTSNYGNVIIQNEVQGAVTKSITKDAIRSLQIPIPPIELQQKFANLVQKVEKLKEKQRESEKELNNLFNSLMQKAFRGELVN